MSFIEVSLWKNGRLDGERVVLCENSEDAEKLYRKLIDALDKIVEDNNDIAEMV